jgi:hypothetical protein
MKRNTFGRCALAAAFGVIALGAAAGVDPNERTVVVQGFIETESDFQVFDENIPPRPPETLSFQATIIETPNTAFIPPVLIDPFFINYQNAVREINFRVTDEMNQVVYEQTMVADENCESFEGSLTWVTYGFMFQEFQIDEGIQWSVRDCNQGNFTQNFSINGGNGPVINLASAINEVSLASLFATTEGYPDLNTGEVFFAVDFEAHDQRLLRALDNSAQDVELNEFQTASYSGYATFISYGDPDSDGDGVPDVSDACSASLQPESGTVWFNGLDSTVTNYVDDSGCTIMDRYAACNAEQEEESTFTRRSFSFYSGPSYCEKQVAYGLVADGIISYAEARMLRDALYNSYRRRDR